MKCNKTMVIAVAGLLTGCASDFGRLGTGEAARLYTLQGKDGLRLEVSDFGGRLVRAWVPDRNGRLDDVALGWNTAEEYERYGCFMGPIIGRYGNRIADGRFVLDGNVYQLPINEEMPPPRHCNVHSSPGGWDAKIWNARQFKDGDADCLELTYVSKDGEVGFPGTVKAKVVYSVLPGNVWRLDYELATDKPTVVNPTHHSYWNLGGEASGSVLDHQLRIFADKYTKTTQGLIPIKDAPVKGTGFDFTELRPIGAKREMMERDPSLKASNFWYDHNFALRGKIGEMHQAAELYEPKSGRVMEIWTTEPCLQMFGCQDFTGDLPTKTPGRKLCKFGGVVFETQHYPDSPNHPEFPSTVLRPGQVFHSITEYRFKTR